MNNALKTNEILHFTRHRCGCRYAVQENQNIKKLHFNRIRQIIGVEYLHFVFNNIVAD